MELNMSWTQMDTLEAEQNGKHFVNNALQCILFNSNYLID